MQRENRRNRRQPPNLHHIVRFQGVSRLRSALNRSYNVDPRDVDGNTPLHYAVKQKNIKKVTVLLLKGASPNKANYLEGNTPLHLSLIEGQEEIYHLLLRHCGFPLMQNKYHQTCLELTAIHRMKSIFLELEWTDPSRVTRLDFLGSTMLHLSCKTKDQDPAFFRMLLRNYGGACLKDRYERTPMHYVAMNNLMEHAEELMKNQGSVMGSDVDGNTPLYFACQNGHPDMVVFLLRHGANPLIMNNFTNSAFHVAVEKGYEDIVRKILEFNGDPFTHHNSEGYTPLHLACLKPETALIDIFVDNSRIHNLPTTESQQSPLSLLLDKATASDDIIQEKTLLLLETDGFNYDNDIFRRNVFHYVCEKGFLEILELLLGDERSRGLDDQDEHGKTPLMLAAHGGFADIVVLLAQRRHEIGVNKVSEERRTALHYAVLAPCDIFGIKKMVFALTDARIVANFDDYGTTPRGYMTRIARPTIEDDAAAHLAYNDIMERLPIGYNENPTSEAGFARGRQ